MNKRATLYKYAKLYTNTLIKYANKFNILRTAATPKNSVIANRIANGLYRYRTMGNLVYSAPTTQFGRNAQNFAENYIPGIRRFNDFRRNMRSNLIQYGRNKTYNMLQPKGTPESNYQEILTRYKKGIIDDLTKFIHENRNNPDVSKELNYRILLANRKLRDLKDRYAEIENIRNAFLLNVPEAQREYIRRLPIYLTPTMHPKLENAAGYYQGRGGKWGTPHIMLRSNALQTIEPQTLFHEFTHALRATEQATPKNKTIFDNAGYLKKVQPNNRSININGRMYDQNELGLIEETRADMLPRYYASRFKMLPQEQYQRINDYMRQSSATDYYKQKVLGTPYSNYDKIDENLGNYIDDEEAYNILNQVLRNSNVPVTTKAPKISNPAYLNYKTILNDIENNMTRSSDRSWMAQNKEALQEELNKRWAIQKKFKDFARTSKGQGIEGHLDWNPYFFDGQEAKAKLWDNARERYKQFIDANNAEIYDFYYRQPSELWFEA